MPTQYHAGRGSPRSTEPSEAKGVLQDTNGIKCSIWQRGWPNVIGDATFTIMPNILTETSAGPLIWDSWKTTEIRIEHTASLMLLQGLEIQRFFSAGVQLRSRNGVACGSFLFLKGELSEIWKVPLLITNVVLAKVQHLPKNLSSEELLGTLISSIL